MELLPAARFDLHQLNEASVGLVSGPKTLARETILKYTPNQAYLVLQELDKSIAGKDILVKNEDALHLKLITIETEKENRRLLPIAQQFHSVPAGRHAENHLSDLLAAHSLGRYNLELKKNVTIDSYQLTDSWRDDAGFIVTDRLIFADNTYDAQKLVAALTPSSEKIVAYTASDFDAVADFDNTVCGFSRDSYLQLLLKNSQVLLAKSGAVDGYIAGNGEQIHAIYAETMELAHSLVKAYIQKLGLKTVRFFTAQGVWPENVTPLKSRQVYRRHTRAVPSLLKFSKIYALNMGVHIV
ncbi:unnamed protein product [Caenorhabditis angaria]|uniref:DUF7596 domain-containing protein n=1 Tax=Caenorhabditis angaria TaxID=860376 RepID=A0A9P1N0Y7_9PELO|nr:unnamed protein product [Caenorhabditis angaria]